MTSPSGRGEDTYFLGREGRQYGPYEWEVVCRMAGEGNLLEGDLLWSPGWPEWVPAEQLDTLQSLVRPSPAPVPPPSRRWWIPVLVLILAALLAEAGAWFLLMHRRAPAYALADPITCRLTPSGEVREIPYGERIRVVLPPGFVDRERILTIGRLKEIPSFAPPAPTVLALVDLTLDDGAQPPRPVELRVAYGPDDLAPGIAPADQLAAYRWDEQGGGWIGLPLRVDESTRTVSVLVDHFSVIGVIKLLGGATAVGAVAVAVSNVGEWALNDVYITPQGNFKILYSKQAITGHGVLNDTTWCQLNPNPGFVYTGEAPRYIQDMGGFLETALLAYTQTLGLRNPAGERKGWLRNYRKQVIVKIDSYFSAVTGAPAYDKIFERLHIPLNTAQSANDARMNLGHELFHAVQGEYYGLAGMKNSMNTWWLEATADYAAHRVAWPTPLAGLNFGCGPTYLTYPLSTRGEITGPGWTDREYQYVTAGWVQYLVERGLDLREMVEAVALDTVLMPPERSLANYLGARGGMETLYRGFAAWMIFTPAGFLHQYPLATFSGTVDRDVASTRGTLTLGSGKQLSHEFVLPQGYAARLWAVRLDKGAKSKAGVRSPLLVQVNEKTSGMVVDLFVVPAGQRALQPPEPVKSFFNENTSVLLKAGPGDLLCLLAANGNTGEGRAEVVVTDTDVLLEIDPPEIPKAAPGQRYDFTIKAEGIPKQVRKARFEWDFGDPGEENEGSAEEPVADGRAETGVSHLYEASEKERTCTLAVVLKDEKGMILAKAEARVTLPVEAPQVVIEPRRGVGPPGATFDFTARARPEADYRFEWTWPGLGRAVSKQGRSSTVAPVFTRPGKHTVTVKLFAADGTLLSTDHAAAVVEGETEEKEAPPRPAPAPEKGRWVLTRQWSDAWQGTDRQPGAKGTVKAGGGSASINLTVPSTYIENGKPRTVMEAFSFSLGWTPLPESIRPEETVELTLSVNAAKMPPLRYRWSTEVSLYDGWYEEKNEPPPKAEWMPRLRAPAASWQRSSQGGNGIADFKGRTTKTVKLRMRLNPDPGEKQVVTLRVAAQGIRFPVATHLYFEYTYQQ